MLNFVIYTPVFSIVLSACLFRFDYTFEPCKPKYMDKRMTYEALMVNEASKRGPIYPITTKSCQEPRAKEASKCI